ncbi:MAG: EAL domain-containing protein [Acidobacteria bacterium]|nr:EAL domain-containing protein [Acidobacteriota bacterium]
MSQRKPQDLFGLLVIALGTICAIYAVVFLDWTQLNLGYWLIMFITVTCSSYLIVKIPGTKGEITVSDTFIFLTLLLFGGEAAVLLAIADGLVASIRITKRPVPFAFNPAVMACATLASVLTVRSFFGPARVVTLENFSARYVMMICILAFVQYIVNSGLAAIRFAMITKQKLWQTWKDSFLWTSITYFAGASAAGIIAKLIENIGFYALLSVVPIVAVVYFTYRVYLRNVEVSQAQAEQAQKHVAELSHHIAEQERISRALKEREEQFRSAFDHAAGMALVSLEGRWEKVNQSLCQILGYTEDQLLATTFQALTHPEDLGNDLHQLYQLRENKVATAQSEKRFFHEAGQEVWILQSVSLVRGDDDSPLHYIFQLLDVTERKQSEEKIYHAAFHDALTGLPNRILLTERLSLAVERAKRHSDYQFAVLFIDLDRFKFVNDSLGHQYGDLLLTQVAERLQGCVRKLDTVARLGGDEFAILLDGIESFENVDPTAERIQEQLTSPFDLNGKEAHISGSIGIALSTSAYQCPEDVLRDSDLAMYRAKANGKARHELFDQSLHDRAVQQMELETALRHAIENQELLLHYQPIVKLDAGKISGFEALVRWKHPKRGVIFPQEFIPLAEETGLIVALDLYVLREACRQIVVWHKQFSFDSPLTISANLSAHHFKHPELIEQVATILRETGIDPHCVRLEVTESLVIADPAQAAEILHKLKLLGVKLSLDDFGTGYSSLSYLHRFPFDILKIDRSFVGRIEEDANSVQIVETIILLAEKLRMDVVAEGIETLHQQTHLNALGCSFGQGYLFSKPVPVELAESLLLKQENEAPTSLAAQFGAGDKVINNWAM